MKSNELSQIVASYREYLNKYYTEDWQLDSDLTEKLREVFGTLMTYTVNELVEAGVDLDELNAVALDDVLFPDLASKTQVK